MKNTYTDDEPIICKFQRPLFTSDGDLSKVLVYNEDRSFMMQQEMDEEDMKEIFPDDELKTYWACVPDEDGYLVPMERLEEQDW